MSDTFVVTDTHIHHHNSIFHGWREQFISPNPNYDPGQPKNYKKNYPFLADLEAHDEHIISDWNKTVTKNDKIIILGDLVWKNHLHYIERLNGHKFLIRGNHDKMHNDAYKLFNQIEGAHYRYSWYTKINGQRVMLSHCPYDSWFSSCHDSWHLYGHCHGSKEELPWVLSFDCGYDIWDGLIHWDTIVKKMTHKEKIKKDYYSGPLSKLRCVLEWKAYKAKIRLLHRDRSKRRINVIINREINKKYLKGI